MINNINHDSTLNDLMKYSSISLKKKRMKKKFLKSLKRYVPTTIYQTWLGTISARPIARCRNYSELGKNLITVEPMW